jgi:hypothetical protein
MPTVKEDRPSYVRFEKRAIEDRAQSIQNGHFSTVDVDFAIITPHGTADEIPRVVSDWFAYLDQQLREDRVPTKFVQYYKEAYAHWKKGEEMPLQGTPIKDWPPVSPAQRSNLLNARVYTVEDLAAANESTLNMLGMGAREMKQKAENWLTASTDMGKVTEELSSLQISNKRLERTVKNQAETIEGLRTQMQEMLERHPVPVPLPDQVEAG